MEKSRRAVVPPCERREPLEDDSEPLLKAIGAFKRGTGMWSRRREHEVRARETRMAEWTEQEILDLGSVDLWEEIDWVAEVCGLSPREKTVLGMAVVEQYSLRQMARQLRVTVYRVRQLLGSALQKCRQAAEGPQGTPCSPRALFWEEVRQKARAIYRPPHRPWWKPGGRNDATPPD